MNSPASRIILAVERAAGDLRRGQAVLLTQPNHPAQLVLSSEHFPADPATHDAAHPAVRLMKISGLLPAAVVRPVTEEDHNDILTVSAEAIAAYPASLASSIERVSDANVPLPEAHNARFIAFRSRFGHEEHLAIVVGDLSTKPSPLVRLHSSCITGDIFASLRCDCGSQLHQSLRIIAQEGVGAVLYLNQEGRGIGIANKLRAYTLQDQGMDTVDANLALGFEADERDFAIAAAMLTQLNVQQITLLTNNPMKVDAITQHGITVTSRHAIITTPTEQNNAYLNTKANKMGHLLPLASCVKPACDHNKNN